MRFKAAELLHIDVAPAFGVADVQQMYAALLAQLSPLSGRGKRDPMPQDSRRLWSARLSHSIAACMAIPAERKICSETC